MKLRLIALLLLLLLLLSGCKTPASGDTDTTPVDTTPPPSEIQIQVHDFFDDTDNYTEPCLVIQSHADLQELYSIAANLPLEGNWPRAKQNNSYPESFFAGNYLVAAMVKTDCPGYTFRSGGYINNRGGSVDIYIHGFRPFPFEPSSGGALLLVPIEGKYEQQPLKLEETYVRCDTRSALTFYDYFTSRYINGQEPPLRTPYIIIESYEEYIGLRDFASQDTDQYFSDHRVIQGNLRTTEYNEQFFENGYLVAAMTKTSSGSYTFEHSAEKKEGKITVKLDGTCPNPSTDDLGGYLFIIPMEGRYAGETVEIDTTRTELPFVG